MISAEDADRAYAEWGCNCGPAAVAAICGLTLDQVRPHMGDFETKRYTNPTLMWQVLRSIGARFSYRGGDLGRWWPTYGLARIQRWSYETPFLVLTADGTSPTLWRSPMAPEGKSPTAKPWAHNRFGDPRQLIHEADWLEDRARERRGHANYLRRIADDAEAEAKRLDEAAADYRAWAKAREAIDAA